MDKAQHKWLPSSPGYSHFRAKIGVCALQSFGELFYTWKTFKLESRLGSNLTFSSGSVT